MTSETGIAWLHLPCSGLPATDVHLEMLQHAVAIVFGDFHITT